MRKLLTALLCCCVALVLVRTALADDLLPEDRSIEEAIDHYVDAKLKTAGVQPAPQAPDHELIRRTTLDLVGRPATVAEAKQYLGESDAAKRVQLVDRLLASASFPRHQADQFDALLMSGTNANIREYLTEAFKENRPWNQMFREMLLGREDDPTQKGALQFTRSRAKDLDKLASDVSTLFFGVNISCAQCHDHPLVADWTQEHFYGMKSFFARTFENGDFVGEKNYGKLDYKTAKGEARNASLMFLTGEKLEEPEATEPNEQQKKDEKQQLEELKKNKQAPPAPSYSRRAKLVEIALKNPESSFFARAIVNQVWHRFMGRGLVAPTDQLHSANAPSHPELLEWLARDFVRHNYDVKRLVRGIVLSKAYGRSSVWESADRPASDLFAVGSIRPLTPFQYGMTLRLGSTNPDQFPADAKPDEIEKRLQGIEGAARGLAGSFEQPGTDFQVSIDEALLLTNGERIERELLRDSGDSLVGRLKTATDINVALDVAGWTVLGRALNADESVHVRQYIEKRADRPVDAWRQVVWAMLTSSECRFNH